MFIPKHLSRLQTQQQKFVNWQGDAELRGEDFTATVTVGNPDVLVGSGGSSVMDAAPLQGPFPFVQPERGDK